ncbi:branched-chain amino acid transport system carrier protein [Weizmannia acidilactici]|uniref:Branched-chain amino acid transport system carrier protein n=1 Tax=Weizmannia acidilactici TaxID=2607726 RepID=A0A5J4J3T5_9BACI|nr:branched-chain amino acid transport system II carrier protein [Weizmannia acidilactici]GER67142.1 branched-chain amino acid transport system carrier protein [Weizmannia acidilactici]GER69652.1 branched-chain amino acid transport system carrier protein [Weizmannia acidilactici]GER72527.1 branched-chain amino acid transport system carrier protein [Weizmannia acidilactici]
MKRNETLFIGFMLFSMFFGAGNLIFPPFLGVQSGTSYWPAMAGFIVTGVGLPVLVIATVSVVDGGIQAIGNRVHPLFSTVFTVIVYLCIGPFLAIPRNANVAYEMGVKPFLPASVQSSPVALLLFSVVFFLLVYLVSLNPEKMSKYLGRWITPVLLVAMVVLCAVGFFKLAGHPLQAPAVDYQTGSFFKGFINGYSTMDALASLAFGIVILTAVKHRGVSNRKQMTAYTLKAGFIAGAILALVYVALGFIGAKMASAGTFQNGTDVLTAVSTLLFGEAGKALLGFIFMLACFTTVVGLTTACGEYFSNLMPKLSYHQVVIAVTLVGFTLSNLGLNLILKFSVPFLEMAYPMTIVLVVLTFFHKLFHGSKKVYGCTLLFTGVFAVIEGLEGFGIPLGFVQAFAQKLPLASAGLEWVVPALIGAAAGLLLSRLGHHAPEAQPVHSKATEQSL